MPKATSTDLYELIHSLNRSEKRYFKLYAENNTIGTHNHYIMLFDAISKQKSYDENALKRTFKYSIKNFKATKYQLYKLILNSLNAFYKHQSELSKVLLNIHSIEILEKKNLHKQSASLLQKTKKIAADNNMTDYLHALEVIESNGFSGWNGEDVPNGLNGFNGTGSPADGVPTRSWTPENPVSRGSEFSNS